MPSTDYLRLIIAELVSTPSEIKIEESSDSLGTLLSVSVAPGDMGVLIGRGGVTAKAIKHLLNCHGFHQRAKVSVKFNDPVRPR